MKNNNWGKTILYIYKYLERITEGIDKLVEREALNSYYYNSTRDNDVSIVAGKIIELTERKKRLINIKVLTEKSLKSIDSLLAKVLIGKYIDEDICEEIALRLNLPMRTFFRRLSQAEDMFSNALSRFGFNDEKLNKYLQGENWIIDVYENFLEGDRQNERQSA